MTIYPQAAHYQSMSYSKLKLPRDNIYPHFFREYSSQIPRAFTVRYNPYTQSVELINKRSNCVKMIRDLASEMKTLEDAVSKLED